MEEEFDFNKKKDNNKNNAPGVYEVQIDEKKKLKQEKVQIGEIEVYFPYKPYDVQVNYMKSVIESLNGKKHALLQSPTGTGKTLCLLCASLAWLHQKRKEQIRNKDQDPVRIIYSSRTHSQLQQVIKELKKTVYKPTCSILGSRDQYCIKPDFAYLKGNVLISNCLKACKQKDSDNKCNFFQGQHGDNNKEKFTGEIQDIEELKATGLNKGFCPYFHSRRLKDVCDILLLPYNYLLDMAKTPVFSIEIKDCVVIFDEAHNVQSVSEDGASYHLPLATVDETEKEINILEDHILKEQKDPNRTTAQFKKKMENVSEIDTQGLKTSAGKIENFRVPLQSLRHNMFQLMQDDNRLKKYSQVEHGLLAEGRQIFDMFQNFTKYDPENDKQQQKINNVFLKKKAKRKETKFDKGINISNYQEYTEIMTGMISDLSTTQNWGLDGLKAFISGIFSLYRQDIQCSEDNKSWAENQINHYKLYFKVDKENDTCVFNLWCMDPSLSFQKILDQHPQNIILTSGTMIPFKPWEAELKMDFGVKLENGHVIDHKKNLLAGVVKRGPANEQLCFDYQNRDNEKMINDLGMTILNLARNIPNGALVIFSSYSVLAKCKHVWYNHDFQIMQRISEIKDVIFEPKVSGNMQDTMNRYIKASKTKRGAILFAVCRGKISEGIDFTDELARAVFIVGVPYPPKAERKVEVKQQYLDNICKRDDIQKDLKLTGSDWYQLQAVRAYNQAIGRVIRHKDDWGAVFFCDCRYDGSQMKSQMSEWMRRDLQIWHKFGESIKASVQFYNTQYKRIKETAPLEIKEGNNILQDENSQSNKLGWDCDNLQKKPGSKRKQNNDINFSTVFSNNSLNNNNNSFKNLSQTLNKNLVQNNNKKPLIRQYSNTSINSSFSGDINNNKVNLGLSMKSNNNYLQQNQQNLKSENNNIQNYNQNSSFNNSNFISNNNNNQNNYENENNNNSIKVNQFQGVQQPKGLASIFLKNPKYQKNQTIQSQKENSNQYNSNLNQSPNILNKLKQNTNIKRVQSQKKVQNQSSQNNLFKFTDVIEENTRMEVQNTQEQNSIQQNSSNQNHYQQQQQNGISSNHINNQTSQQNYSNNNIEIHSGSKQSAIIDFNSKLKQLKQDKIQKQQVKSIQQPKKYIQQQQEEKEEIDDSKCFICKRKNMKQPLLNRICGHIACQRCWAIQKEQSLYCICKQKIQDKYLVDY